MTCGGAHHQVARTVCDAWRVPRVRLDLFRRPRRSERLSHYRALWDIALNKDIVLVCVRT
jgi:hypothetical protein